VIAEQRGSPGPDRPLRLLWLIKGLGAGGAERLVEQSARHRDPARVAPAVAYLLAEKSTLVESLEHAGCRPVTCLDARSSWDPRWTLRLRKLLQTEHFDVVHIHSPLVAIGTRLAIRSLPRRKRPRIVVTEHNVWGSHAPLTRWADHLTAGNDEVHLAVSAAVLESMPAGLRTATRVVRYGIDAGEIRRQAPDRATVRTSLGVADDEVLVGTVANLRATKGYPDLLRAAATVTSELPQVKFIAIGRGPLLDDLQTLHRELALGDRFEFLGFRPDAVQLMSAFDIFCLASHHEGLPIALMEALALGLPVVATRVGGVAELVTDGKEAVLVPPRQPDRLAIALIELARDPKRRALMAQRSCERGDLLDAPTTVATIEDVYREIVAR
jgi:glycosyltransferase involved in cell wall biosynthesis